MKVISTEKKPIKMWLDDIEDGALEQVKNLANLPFIYKHIAIMPDSHQGFGCPIGSVVATKDVIVTNIIGKDIGCGLCAVKTSLTEIDTETLKKIMGEIRKVIPVGMNKHKEMQDEYLMPEWTKQFCYGGLKNWKNICSDEKNNALKSLGTLGSGNHFISIERGDDGHIWIMIHSGSRNLGLKVAKHYNDLAIELNKRWHSPVPKEWQLAYLPVNSEEGQAYLREMQYCVDFAFANRKLMMERVKDIFTDLIDGFHIYDSLIGEEKMINIAHNYASLENHFGENVWVHRKGATLAREDTIGIIPGSLGSPSYIVKGKGNLESFMSCSHGAGRKMSRTRAKKELNLKEEVKKLDDMGVIHSIRGVEDLDEAVGSYKDIETVMDNQKDLVEVLVKLTPLAVIKN